MTLTPSNLQKDWHSLDAEETIQLLATPPEEGLSSTEATHRLELFGLNQLQEAPRPTFLQLLWQQFNNFIVILLIIAALISAVLGE